MTVGADGSMSAVRALDLAADEAARRGAAVRVVYAVPDLDEAPPILAAAVSRVHDRHPGLPVETRAVPGGAVDALARESDGAELTVVGVRGPGRVGGLLFGSVGLRLATRLDGPLLVARGDRPCGDRPHDARLPVLLVPGGDTGAAAAAFAAAEARRRGVPLRAPRPGAVGVPRLVPVQAAYEAAGSTGHGTRTGQGVSARTLIEATREAAFVVVGLRRLAGRPGPHPGSCAHLLLHRSHCPVALVPERP
ncbi:hypothetical protein WN71_006575 [Streptomyces mangrovisoli]|uniref:UspA domain-containing protein n=1 Tax=Streptomyces mangrovisoli TaxID=1428628 RepID=A0A1J4P5F1_9ACTN|nr:hypothetical protein WN71_006575 [Streptomyces mangrovisoli]